MEIDEIDKIEEELKTCDEPIALASYLTRLAAWNSYRLEQFKKIQLIKPAKWLEIQSNYMEKGMMMETSEVIELGLKLRDKPLSDKKTDMIWASTEDGQKETALTYELKRINAMTSAIRTRLFTLRDEIKNLNGQI